MITIKVKLAQILVLTVVVLIGLTACSHNSSNQEELMPTTIQKLFPGDLASVNKIELVAGWSGIRKSITNTVEIANILNDMKSERLTPEDNQEVVAGYLFRLILYVNEEAVMDFTPQHIQNVYYMPNDKINAQLITLFEENGLTPSPTFQSGNTEMIGLEGNIAILSPGFIAGKVNRYMWHFWGTEKELNQVPFRVEAINLDTGEKIKALVKGAGTNNMRQVWEHEGLAGPNNGADAHIPTSMVLPTSGMWQLDAYLGGKQKGSIVVTVNKE